MRLPSNTLAALAAVNALLLSSKNLPTLTLATATADADVDVDKKTTNHDDDGRARDDGFTAGVSGATGPAGLYENHDDDEYPECGLWLAESTIKGAGLGVFTGKRLPAHHTMTEFSDHAITLWDVDFHTDRWQLTTEETEKHWNYYLKTFFHEPHSMPGMDVDMEGNQFGSQIFIPGLGGIPACHYALNNIGESFEREVVSTYDSAGLHRSRDPGAGANVGYTHVTHYTFKEIPPGAEIFGDYGPNFFDERVETIGHVPKEEDYDRVDAFLKVFRLFIEAHNDTIDRGFRHDLWDLIVEDDTVEFLEKNATFFEKHADVIHGGGNNNRPEKKESDDAATTTVGDDSKGGFGGDLCKDLLHLVKAIPSQTRTRKALPKSHEDAELALNVGIYQYEFLRSIRTPDWLSAHGKCMDNIRPKRSTIKQAGNGAFATRFIPRGGLVGPAPLLHIPDRTIFDTYEEGDLIDEATGERGEMKFWSLQLMINYCFGHRKSSMLLCPYGANTAYINHSSKRPNAKIVWATDSVNHHPECLTKTPEELESWWTSCAAFDYVATRDIKPGEEVFIDYGPEWEYAWIDYVRDWKAPPGSENYVRISDLNDLDEPIRTNDELQTDPYPDNCVVMCYPWTAMGSKEHHPCEVISRHTHANGTLLYEVDITYANGETEVLDLQRGDIKLVDKIYTTDEHMQNAFRHEMMIPDDMLPRAWANEPWADDDDSVDDDLEDEDYYDDYEDFEDFGGDLVLGDPTTEDMQDIIAREERRKTEEKGGGRGGGGKADDVKTTTPTKKKIEKTTTQVCETYGTFQSPPLDVGEVRPLTWSADGKRVAEYAVRVGLPPHLTEIVKKYADDIGVTELFRSLLYDDPLTPGHQKFMKLGGYEDGDDEDGTAGGGEKKKGSFKFNWYANRPERKWQSNMHWVSPADERSHEDYLKVLAEGGFDSVLAAIGEHFALDSLVVHGLGFIGVSHCSKGYMHNDMTQTGGKFFNVLFPLVLEDDADPEFMLQDDVNDDRTGAANYEFDVALVVGDDAYHGTAACDYRSNRGMRMAATLYVADINDDNVEMIATDTTQVFPVPNSVEWANAQRARHWGGNNRLVGDRGRRPFEAVDEWDERECAELASRGMCESDPWNARMNCLKSCHVYLGRCGTAKDCPPENVHDDVVEHATTKPTTTYFESPPLKVGEVSPLIWSSDGKRASDYAVRIGLPPRLTTELKSYCDRIGVTDLYYSLEYDDPILPGGHRFLELGDDDGGGEKHVWYASRPDRKWNSNMHWVSPADERTHEDYLKVLAAGDFDTVLDAIGRYYNLDGLVVHGVGFIGVSKCTRGLIHEDMSGTGGKFFNVLIPLVLQDDGPPEFMIRDDDDEGRMGAARYEYDVAMAVGDGAYHGTASCDYTGAGDRTRIRMAATLYIADINNDNVDIIAADDTQVFPVPGDVDWAHAQRARHWGENNRLVGDKGRRPYSATDEWGARTCERLVADGKCESDPLNTRMNCLKSCGVYMED